MPAKAPKSPARILCPNMSIRKLVNALKQRAERTNERPARTYAEQIRELIGSPERCIECRGEHPTCFCMKRFKKFRESEMTPLPATDDDSTNSDTLCDSKGPECY